MRATHDVEAGATYVYLTDRPVARTVALSDSVNVDLDADGNPCGVEVLEANSRPMSNRIYGVGCETCDWVGVMEDSEPCPGCDPVQALIARLAMAAENAESVEDDGLPLPEGTTVERGVSFTNEQKAQIKALVEGGGVGGVRGKRIPDGLRATFSTPATGDLSRRINGAAKILRNRAKSARGAASILPKDSPMAAALRGKANGYAEAADLLLRLDHGDRLPPKRHHWEASA